jgi:DNA-binding transcriptional ArsR family regulator
MGRNEALSDRELIRAMKALADPARFRMVQEIAAAGELSCSQIGEHFDLSQPTVSHHLKILTESGVLVMRSEGKHHLTSVNHALLKALGELIPARLSWSANRTSSSTRS